MKTNKLIELFDVPKIVSIVGDINQGKSNLLYFMIEELKKVGDFNLYTYGLKNEIENAIKIYSVNELEQIKNSVIFIDEVMNLFDLDNRMEKKQIENTLRLISQNNNILVICAVPENIKKFISGKINIVILKKVIINDFINGSSIKRVVTNYKGVEKGSSVLSLEKDEAIIYDGLHYNKINIPYMEKYDNKRKNPEIVKKFVNESVKVKKGKRGEVIGKYK